MRPEDLAGQVILFPALNTPAVLASSRTSPLDGGNLNRAFPGDENGGPTAMIAHFIEAEILPICDAAIDLHSGGKASFFAPCALATNCSDMGLAERNMDLARALGLPLIWRLGALNDNRSLNSAAERQGVPMIAAELGGGGGIDPSITNQAERGLRQCLQHLGVLAGNATLPPHPARVVELIGPQASLFATGTGLFDRAVAAGADVAKGDLAGMLHYICEPERASEPVTFASSGLVLAHSCRGLVQRGDMLARDVS
ncbi:MAG: succinylglutamate desuccinylase/aspartoacylase family protein [Roseobacter sp.]